MKKAFFILLVIVFLSSSFMIASQYFRYELYDLAIAFEKDQAELEAEKLTLGKDNYYVLTRARSQPAETILLLHGFSADKENWLRFSQHIPDNYQIYALDLLGHGQHEIDLSRDYSIESQVAYLEQFVTQKIDQTFHLIGNSMGGAIASLYAAQFPDKVKSLMLISPAGVHDIPSDMDKLIETGPNPLIADTTEQFYNVLNFVMEDPPFIPDAILNVQAEKSVARYALNQKIFTDIRNDLKKQLERNFSSITSPTFILWGKQDRVINSANIDRYASLIQDSEFRVLEGIGHLAMLEAPKLSAGTFINLVSQSNQ